MYRWKIKVDQRRHEYSRTTYRNLDWMYTVEADTFDDATAEIIRIAPEKTHGYEWAFFIQEVEPVEEVDETEPEPEAFDMPNLWPHRPIRARGIL